MAKKKEKNNKRLFLRISLIILAVILIAFIGNSAMIYLNEKGGASKCGLVRLSIEDGACYSKEFNEVNVKVIALETGSELAGIKFFARYDEISKSFEVIEGNVSNDARLYGKNYAEAAGTNDLPQKNLTKSYYLHLSTPLSRFENSEVAISPILRLSGGYRICSITSRAILKAC